MVDEGAWPDGAPAEVLRRQGDLQRQINENRAAIEARKDDIRRTASTLNAKLRAFEAELLRQSELLKKLEAALMASGQDENIQQLFSRLGVVTLTPEQRAIFGEEISDKVFEKQVAERAKKRDRITDKRWVRISAAVTLFFLAYPSLFGGGPLLPGILRFFHLTH